MVFEESQLNFQKKNITGLTNEIVFVSRCCCWPCCGAHVSSVSEGHCTSRKLQISKVDSNCSKKILHSGLLGLFFFAVGRMWAMCLNNAARTPPAQTHTHLHIHTHTHVHTHSHTQAHTEAHHHTHTDTHAHTVGWK